MYMSTTLIILFSLSDKGMGIAATDIEKIITSFFRSDLVNHSEIKGTGLGLSIVADCARLLGGIVKTADSSWSF